MYRLRSVAVVHGLALLGVLFSIVHNTRRCAFCGWLRASWCVVVAKQITAVSAASVGDGMGFP